MGPALTIASTPRSWREPCAAWPVTSISDQTKPLWATISSSSVGSVTIAASAVSVRQHLLDAQARVLLVGDSGADHVAAKPEARRLAAGDQRRGDPGLHVVGATAVEAIALDSRRMRIAHPRDGDGVAVATQQQGPPAAPAAGANHHARTARGSLQDLDLQPDIARPGGDEGRDLALARAPGHQRRIDRVDRDQLREELGCGLSSHATGRGDGDGSGATASVPRGIARERQGIRPSAASQQPARISASPISVPR